MNQSVSIHQARAPSRVEVFMSRVMTQEDRAAIKAALPTHIPFARFERNLSNALMNEPRLLECNPREVFREVAKLAALGLLIDSQLGEAYLIASRTGPQARVGYRGLIKLARQSGDVSMIYAHEVYENDEIECLLGDEKKLRHKPNLFGERGEIVGYYAVIKFKDGDTDFEPMTPDQINKIRDKSDGYRAFKSGKIKDTPWATSYEEMAKKTCIRRLMKRCPQSPELSSALGLEDHAEFPSGEPREHTHIAAPKTVSDRLDALAGGADHESGEIVEHAEHDEETGEVIAEHTEHEVAATELAEAARDDPRAALIAEGQNAATGGTPTFNAWWAARTDAERALIGSGVGSLLAGAKLRD